MVLPVSNALKQSQVGSDKVACQWGVGPEVKGGGLAHQAAVCNPLGC